MLLNLFPNMSTLSLVADAVTQTHGCNWVPGSDFMEVVSQQSKKPRVLSCWGHSETRPGNRIPNMADGTRRGGKSVFKEHLDVKANHCSDFLTFPQNLGTKKGRFSRVPVGSGRFVRVRSPSVKTPSVRSSQMATHWMAH